MPIESQLPEDDPMSIAWKEFKQTEIFHNSMNWILGALWSAFAAGYTADKKPKCTLFGDCLCLNKPVNNYKMWLY